MKARRNTLIAILLVILLVIIMHAIGWLRPIENMFRSIINPASIIIFKADTTLDNQIVTLARPQDLKRAYDELVQKYAGKQVDAARLNQLEEENKQLRAQLRFFSATTTKHIGADVIGRSTDPLSSTFIINRGSADGVALNNPVIVGEGILVGKVIRLAEQTAIVQLINDSESRLGATVLNNDKSIGVVEGGFGIVIRMKFIPQNEVLAAGDLVITSGLETYMPRGLLIGTVNAVDKRPQEPFQEAVLEPAYNLGHITSVSVLIAN